MNNLTIIFFIMIFIAIYLYFANQDIFTKNNLNDTMVTLQKYISRTNIVPIANKYEIIKNNNDFSDFHVVIYFIDDFNCKIILRRLDDNIIVYPISLRVYDSTLTNNILINIPKSNNNTVIFEYTLPFKLLKTNISQTQLIPKIIIQTGESNKISEACYVAIQTFIELNPEYKYVMYDKDDRIDFIKNNFNKDVLEAYEKLIPGAYKADLFRYCALYVNGGCYFDIKQILRVPLRELINTNDEIILTQDCKENAYTNCIILVKPRHSFMLQLINKIVENTKNNYYGDCALCPTGPCLLYKICKQIKPKFVYDPSSLEVLISTLRYKSQILYKNNKIITFAYKGYYTSLFSDYAKLWIKKNIYKLN